MILFPKITSFISEISVDAISEERKDILQSLIDHISHKLVLQEDVALVFICTHNSRRSQIAQIWAQAIASYFGVKLDSYSGGVEITEFNKYALSSLKNIGFEIENNLSTNLHYFITFSMEHPPLEMFSKLYDDPINDLDHCIAIMTCSDADSNCPMISGTEKRISLTYEDPKKYDGTHQQIMKYHETNTIIATELYYVFSKLRFRK